MGVKGDMEIQGRPSPGVATPGKWPGKWGT